MPSPFADVSALLDDAVRTGAFPAATIEVGGRDGVLWRKACGTLTCEPYAAAASAETIFDLASLTKVIATTPLVMRAIDSGTLTLDDPVARWLPEWSGRDRAGVTIADLLSHSSGLTAYLPFFHDYTGRIDFQQAICTLPLEYAPRSRSIYSDLGFMLLGFILEEAYRSSASFAGAPGAVDPARRLAPQFTRLANLVTSEPLAFNPPRRWRDRTAPTETDPWRGRLLIGEVHDENAWALGGAAGHAGVFGTVGAVGSFARAMLAALLDGDAMLAQPETMWRFVRPTGVTGSSRALGWDTMLPTSSCGTRLSPASIGHTGFTGTSLWIDWERDVYVVFLTNRVHPTRANQAIRQLRPRLHDAVITSWERQFR